MLSAGGASAAEGEPPLSASAAFSQDGIPVSGAVWIFCAAEAALSDGLFRAGANAGTTVARASLRSRAARPPEETAVADETVFPSGGASEAALFRVQLTNSPHSTSIESPRRT